MEENSESGISTIENREECMSEGIERDHGLATDVPHLPHVSQLSNDKYDNDTKNGERVCASTRYRSHHYSVI